jgi:TolB-like protein/Flp pilus assembly protein TadD
MSFWGELRRRNVFKVGVAYLVAAWLLAQVVALVEAPLELPGWLDTTVIVLLAVGFPVALLLAWAYELTPDGIKKTRQVPLEQSIAGLTGQKLNYIVTGLLVLAVGFLAANDYLEDRAGGGGAADADGATGEVAAEVATPTRDVLANSVAVLQCDNFSTDESNAFFAASLHEEMLNQLVKLKNLSVIARTSVLQYSGADRPSITRIAEELRVGSVMECSVAYGEGRIVISVQLINGDTGVHVWSERYNREFKDVFGIQADIAMNVANALAVEFSTEEQHAIERAPTDSPEAYALYLQAVSLVDIDNAQALSLLDRALSFDPDFAEAHRYEAALFSASLINTTGSNAISPNERERQIELARDHAARAVEIDPSLAWIAGTAVNFNTWRWTEALAALETAPDAAAPAPVWINSYIGEHEKAIGRARRAVELDPRNWNAKFVLGIALHYAGESDEAAQTFRDAAALAPAVPVLRSWLAFIEIARGNPEVAAAELARAEQLLAQNRQVVFLPELAYSYARLGRRADAERIVAEIEQAPAGVEIGSGGRTMLYLARGDRARVVAELEAAIVKIENHQIDEGFFNLLNVRMNVTADPLLEEPDLAALRERLRGE